MNRKLLITVDMIVMCFVWVVINSCSMGGSEIGNPLALTGLVTDSTGKGVAGASLFLVDPAERNPEVLMPENIITTNSDDSGWFHFSDIGEGVWNLMGIDDGGETMFLRKVDLLRLYDETFSDDTVMLKADTLVPAAAVVISVNGNTSGGCNRLFIPGTVINVPVDSSGEYIVRCPSGTVDILLCENDTVISLAKDLAVSAGEWVDLTGKNYTLPAPRIISGLQSGFTGQTYSFTADSITLGPDHPVHYRFDWGDNVVSSWSSSCQNRHAWGSPGGFSVRVQARSGRDTSAVSAWSEDTKVTIR